MKPIQWLFVGGPAHGTAAWVKYGSSVLWSAPSPRLEGCRPLPKAGTYTEYWGENVHSDGRLYRVGRCDLPIPEGAETCVYSLIRSTKLEPVA